jgi:leader peptidase (prepilin peptidase)/N-methyltransferase
LIEILTALVCFLVYYLTFPNQLYFFYLLILSIFLVSVLVVDFEHKIIPDQLVFPAYLLVVLFLFLTNDSLFFQHLFWGFLAALFLLLVNLLTKGKGMGLGDVKLALVGGTFFGWPLALIWLFLAFLTGALIGIILILLGKTQFGKKIAFGPFLVVSFFLAILCKDFLIRLII